MIYFNWCHLFWQPTLLQHFCCWKCHDLHSWKPHIFAKEEFLLRLFYWQEINKPHKNPLKQISVADFSCVEKEFLLLLKSLLLFYYNKVLLWFPFILISFYISVMCILLRFFSHEIIKGLKSNQWLYYEEIIYVIKVVIDIVQIKQQYIREFSDSPVKIIFHCSLEIIEGCFYVAQIKIPFNREKKSTQISVLVLVKCWHFAWEKRKTICKIKILLWKKKSHKKKSGKFRDVHFKQECHWIRNSGKRCCYFYGEI